MTPSPTDGPAAARASQTLEASRMDDGAQTAVGRVIVNPISGERIVIRQSGAETDGQLLSFDLFLPPGGHVPARHVHPVQVERFTVLAGVMRFEMGGETILARPGEGVVVPSGKPHWFGNAGGEVAHALVEVRPALRMEEVFESSAAMGQVGRIFGARLPRLTELARFLIDFRREVAVPYVPWFVIRAALAPIAWLGRRQTPGGECRRMG